MLSWHPISDKNSFPNLHFFPFARKAISRGSDGRSAPFSGCAALCCWEQSFPILLIRIFSKWSNQGFAKVMEEVFFLQQPLITWHWSHGTHYSSELYQALNSLPHIRWYLLQRRIWIWRRSLRKTWQFPGVGVILDGETMFHPCLSGWSGARLFRTKPAMFTFLPWNAHFYQKWRGIGFPQNGNHPGWPWDKYQWHLVPLQFVPIKPQSLDFWHGRFRNTNGRWKITEQELVDMIASSW